MHCPRQIIVGQRRIGVNNVVKKAANESINLLESQYHESQVCFKIWELVDCKNHGKLNM